MTESGFLQLKSRVLKMLDDGLDPRLTYHCLEHTTDVLRQSERIAVSEGITDTRLLMLIRTAALFHDTGFLCVYKDMKINPVKLCRSISGKTYLPLKKLRL